MANRSLAILPWRRFPYPITSFLLNSREKKLQTKYARPLIAGILSPKKFFLPYWLYDIDYSSEAKWSFRKYRFPTGNSVLEVYATTSHANFEHFSIAACESFSREYAKHIEPYNLAELVPYDNNLTNGYYSAHFDTPAERAKAVALDRIQDMMIKKVRIAVNEIPHFEPMTYRGLFENALRYNINYEEYALLPVWYYRVVCRGHTYIAIANGQTGKVELDLPTGKPRLIRNVLLLFLMNSVLFLFLAEAADEFSSLEITPTQWYGLGLLCNLVISFLFAKLFSRKHGPIGEDEVTAEDFNTEFDIKFHDDW